jgi:hypothetical protein
MPTTTTASTTRRAHSVPTHPSVRRHRGQVARWALANGHLVERDALAAIVAVRTDASTGAVDMRWTAQDIGAVMWSAVPLWCSTHQVPAPSDVATTLGTYLRFLSAHRQLARGSAPIAELRRAVADHRPSQQRSRARHPAAGRTAPVLPIC